jgi:hypothetical protein
MNIDGVDRKIQEILEEALYEYNFELVEKNGIHYIKITGTEYLKASRESVLQLVYGYLDGKEQHYRDEKYSVALSLFDKYILEDYLGVDMNENSFGGSITKENILATKYFNFDSKLLEDSYKLNKISDELIQRICKNEYLDCI